MSVHIENDEILDEKYFEKFISKLKKKSKEEVVWLKNLYVLENPITRKEINIQKRYTDNFTLRNVLGLQLERDSLYYKKLFDSKKITTYPILITHNGRHFPYYAYDFITGIQIPVIYLETLNELNCQSEIYLEEANLEKTTYFIVEESLNSKQKEYPEFQLLIDKNKKATSDEIKMYLEELSNKHNLLNYLEFIFSLVETCKFDKEYQVSPLIPWEIVPLYKKYLNHNLTLKEEKTTSLTVQTTLTEKRDKSLNNIELILEIKNKIQKLPEEKQIEYNQQIENLLEKYGNVSYQEHNQVGYMLLQELCNIRAQIICIEKNNIFYELFQYFNNISKLTLISLTEEKNINQEEIFMMIQIFLNNKEKLKFQEYYQLQEIIFLILTNILIDKNSNREDILIKLPLLYHQGIKNKLEYLLRNYPKESLDNNIHFTIIELLLLTELEDLDFIKKSLNIIDKIDISILKEEIIKEVTPHTKKKLKNEFFT